jgi:hypothetical protein
MQRMRLDGDGPEFLRMAAHLVRYRKSALDAYISSRARRSIREEAA